MCAIVVRADLAEREAVQRIACRLGVDADMVVGKLARLWSWFAGHAASGRAHLTAAWVDGYLRIDGFAAALADVGWLIVEPGAIALHKPERALAGAGQAAVDRVAPTHGGRFTAETPRHGDGQQERGPLSVRERVRRHRERRRCTTRTADVTTVTLPVTDETLHVTNVTLQRYISPSLPLVHSIDRVRACAPADPGTGTGSIQSANTSALSSPRSAPLPVSEEPDLECAEGTGEDGGSPGRPASLLAEVLAMRGVSPTVQPRSGRGEDHESTKAGKHERDFSVVPLAVQNGPQAAASGGRPEPCGEHERVVERAERLCRRLDYGGADRRIVFELALGVVRRVIPEAWVADAAEAVRRVRTVPTNRVAYFRRVVERRAADAGVAPAELWRRLRWPSSWPQHWVDRATRNQTPARASPALARGG